MQAAWKWPVCLPSRILLVGLMVCSLPCSALASTESAEDPIPALRLEALEDGTLVLLDHDGDTVGRIPEGSLIAQNAAPHAMAAAVAVEGERNSAMMTRWGGERDS